MSKDTSTSDRGDSAWKREEKNKRRKKKKTTTETTTEKRICMKIDG